MTGELNPHAEIIDGALVHSDREPTEEQRAMISEVIKAARAKFAEEHPDA